MPTDSLVPGRVASGMHRKGFDVSARSLRNLAREMQSGSAPSTTVIEMLDAEADAIDALRSDRLVYRIVVIALGIVAISAMLGVILVLLIGADESSDGVSQVLTALGSASIGALAGLLTPSPGSTSR